MRWKTQKEGAPLILAKTATRLSWKRQFKKWLPSIVDAGGVHITASSRLPAHPLVCPRPDHGEVRTPQLPSKCPLCVAKGEQRNMEGMALSEAVIFSVLTEEEKRKFMQRSVDQWRPLSQAVRPA